jgi:hypothetical protein
MPSPTQRSKQYLKDQGYAVCITEHWNPFAHIRQDAFGFIDMIALGEQQILAIQTTSRNNVSARMNKILGLAEARLWLQAGGRIFIHGWGLVGVRGKRKKHQVRVVELVLSDFPLVTPVPSIE